MPRVATAWRDPRDAHAYHVPDTASITYDSPAQQHDYEAMQDRDAQSHLYETPDEAQQHQYEDPYKVQRAARIQAGSQAYEVPASPSDAAPGRAYEVPARVEANVYQLASPHTHHYEQASAAVAETGVD